MNRGDFGWNEAMKDSHKRTEHGKRLLSDLLNVSRAYQTHPKL